MSHQCGQSLQGFGRQIYWPVGRDKLCDSMHPDYRNAIKEAISAIEGAPRIITGNQNKELG